MKKLFRDPEPPVQLYIKEGDEFKKIEPHRVCAHCRIIMPSEELALSCCKQGVCESCGKDTEYQHWLKCNACQDIERRKLRRANATFIDPDTYTGPVYDDSTDHYYEDIEMIYDGCSPEEIEEGDFYACDVIALKDADAGRIADNIIENEIDDHHEEAFDHIVDEAGLQEAIKGWLSKQTLESWLPDYTRRIKLKPVDPSDMEQGNDDHPTRD